MATITSITELKYSIAILEQKRTEEKLALQQTIKIVHDNLKPSHFIKNILSDIFSSKELKDGFISSALGIGAGFLSKKIVVHQSSSIIRKTLGSILQFGVTRFISSHSGDVKTKSIGFFKGILNTIMERKHDE